MDLTPLIASFGVVAIAEFGDKTQLAAITLCSRHRPASVFAGTMLAFTLVDGVGVLIGGALASLLPISLLKIGSGIVFILFGLYTLRSEEAEPAKRRNHKIGIIASFSMVVLMEMGDKTQFAVLALAAEYGAPLQVFTGVMLAFLLATGIALTLGVKLLKRIPQRYVKVFTALVFVILGTVFILTA